MNENNCLWDNILNQIIARNPQDSKFKNFCQNIKIINYEQDNLCLGMDQATYDQGCHDHSLDQFLAYAKGIFLSKDLTLSFQLTNIKNTNVNPPVESTPTSPYPLGLVNIDTGMSFKNFIVTEQTKNLKDTYDKIMNYEKYKDKCFPIFIYGNSGTGKTHLVNAFAIHWHQNHPDTNVFYLEAGELTRTMQSINQSPQKQEEYLAFKNKILFYDLVIIDDFQMFAEKYNALELFFDIFNEMKKKNKILFVTSDRNISSINGIPDRFISRLSGGIKKCMPVLDEASCKQFITTWIHQNHYTLMLDDDAMDLLCQTYTHDIRSLMGALSTIENEFDTTNQHNQLSVERICDILDLKHSVKQTVKPSHHAQELKSPEPEPQIRIETGINADYVISAVSMAYNVNPNVMKGRSRAKNVVYARNLCIYILNTKLGFNHTQIADIFGKERSTITSSLRKHTKLFDNDKMVQTLINSLFKELHC